MTGRKSIVVLLVAVIATAAMGQDWKTEIPKQITTPNRTDSKIGDLEFKDGFPTKETSSKLRDELDYIHAVNAFMMSCSLFNRKNSRVLVIGIRNIVFVQYA